MGAIQTLGSRDMITLSFPYVMQRGRTYRYRRVVPADIRKAIGFTNWIKTWRRGTPLAVVEVAARQLALQHDREIAVARGQEAVASARDWLSGDPADLAFFLTMLADTPKGSKLSPQIERVRKAIAGGGRLPVDSPTISEAVKRDVELYGEGRKDTRHFGLAVKTLIALIGDKPITEISRTDALAWIASEKQRVAVSTIKRRLNTLQGMVKRAFRDLEIDKRNPFAEHIFKNGNGKTAEARLPFNKPMLAMIENYLNTAKRLKHETRNALRMMIGTTMGPGEVTGLTLSDVILDAEIPYAWVRVNALRGLKGPERDRQLPLIGTALKAAKNAVALAVERAEGKSPDKTQLFAGFRPGEREADGMGKNLNNAIRRAGVPKSPRLSAYSFRHTLAEALKSANIPPHLQDRLLGHAGGKMSARYGASRGRLVDARDAILAAMPFLGDVDDSIYSEQERMK